MKMKCPMCKKVLVSGKLRRYETLLDHVCNPNEEYYPERESFVCSCKESEGCFWDPYGDFYCDHNAEIDYLKLKDKFRLLDAINSGSRNFHVSWERRNKMEKHPIGKIILTMNRCCSNMKYFILEKIGVVKPLSELMK